MPRILVTGISSIHGWPIFLYFNELYPGKVLGIKNRFAKEPVMDNVVSVNMEESDLLTKTIHQFDPSHIIHCAGMCDLDKSEDHPDLAYDLNVNAAKCIASKCQNRKLIYLSYDLIFSGKNNNSGYREDDSPDPLTVVGKTIVGAEEVFQQLPDYLIIRLALPLGASIQGCKGAVDWIESRFKKNRIATLLYDEVRSTINVEDVGPGVDKLFFCTGIYHLGSPWTLSIYQIGERLIQTKNYPNHLLEGKIRKEFPPSPPRMGNVSLNCEKAYRIMDWIPAKWSLCQ